MLQHAHGCGFYQMCDVKGGHAHGCGFYQMCDVKRGGRSKI